MKPMIFFDVDGTLRDNHHHQVCPSTIEALNKLHEYGYKIGVATGRSVNSLKRTGIPDLIKWDGYVCNNGQSILDQDYNLIQELIGIINDFDDFIDYAKKSGMFFSREYVIKYLEDLYLKCDGDDHPILENE